MAPKSRSARQATPIDEEQPSLLILPPEVLTTVVSFMGRTSKAPSPNPVDLFRTCRELHLLGRDTTTRIEFLIGNYGLHGVLEGISSWLALVTRDVLGGLLGRLSQGTDGNAPRYQLQRLYRRITNAGRMDLLLPLLTYAEELYPAKSSATYGGPKGFAPVAMGFLPSLPDEDIVKNLLKSGVVPEDLNYLVEEGVEGGWEVKEDPIMTALLTLRTKYGLDPNWSLPGRSPASARLLFRNQGTQDRYYNTQSLDRSTGGFVNDTGVDGINAGHSLLVEYVAAGNEANVRRLLRFGVNTQADSQGNSFFWDSVNGLLEGYPGAVEEEPLRYGDGERSAQVISEYLGNANAFPVNNNHPYGNAYGYHQPAASTTIVRPSKDAILGAICRFYTAAKPYDTYSLFNEKARNGDYLDALQVAVGKAQPQTTDAVLRVLLQHLHEQGWFQTEAGRTSLEKCQAMCLKIDKLDFLNVLQNYARQNIADGAAEDLVSALCAQDREKVLAMLEEGQRMTDNQAVSVLRSRHLPVALEIMQTDYPFEPAQLKTVMTTLIKTAGYNDRERFLATVTEMLLARADLFPGGGDKDVVLGWFEDNTLEWAKAQLRPLLGPAVKGGKAAVLQYDLNAAIGRNDVKEIKKLVKLGGKLSVTQIYSYLSRYQSPTVSTICDVINSMSFTPQELSTLLQQVIRRNEAVVKFLLSPSRKVKPIIGYEHLRECMMNGGRQKYVESFKLLLEAAKAQSEIIDRARMAGKMARNRGGAWEKSWDEYEAVMADE